MKTVSLTTITFALVVGLASPARAMESDSYPQTIHQATPVSGDNAGSLVVFGDGVEPGVGLAVVIDGQTYVDPRDRSSSAARGAALPGTADQAGRFSFSLDLRGARVTRDQASEFHELPLGRHVLYIATSLSEHPARSQEVTFEVGPTPSPSPSPAVVAGTKARREVTLLAVAGGLLGCALAVVGIRRFIRS